MKSVSRSHQGSQAREFDVQCVDNTRDVTQNRQEDVDEEISAATALEEDAERWDEDGKDDLDDVAGRRRHVSFFVRVCERVLCAPPSSRCSSGARVVIELTFR